MTRLVPVLFLLGGVAGLGCQNPSSCVTGPVVPLYDSPAYLIDGDIAGHQPMFGAEGRLRSGENRFEGYSVVVTWADQTAALAGAGRNQISVWPGFFLEDGSFLQSGFSEGPGAGKPPEVFVEVLAPVDGGGTHGIHFSFQFVQVAEGDRLQFLAELESNAWVFRYRLVGGDGGWVEHGRFESVARGIEHLTCAVEMYDHTGLNEHTGSADKLQPVRFSSLSARRQPLIPRDDNYTSPSVDLTSFTSS